MRFSTSALVTALSLSPSIACDDKQPDDGKSVLEGGKPRSEAGRKVEGAKKDIEGAERQLQERDDQVFEKSAGENAGRGVP